MELSVAVETKIGVGRSDNMWKTPHSETGWNLGTEDESTEYFTLNGVTCYHDLLTDKYYAFLGITSDRKVEFETRESILEYESY